MPENFISQLLGGVWASLISQPLIWLLFAVAVAASCVFCQNVFTKHQGAVRRVGVIKNTAQPMWAGVRCFG